MRAATALTCFAVLSLSCAEETTTEVFQNNYIDTKPSVRLDPYIRKALLKALTELEESESIIDQAPDVYEPDSETGKKIDFAKVPSPTEDPRHNIRFHSFIVDGQAAFENASNSIRNLGDSKISILTTTAGNVENQAETTIPTQEPYQEIFQAKASGINVQQVRSIKSDSARNKDNVINNDDKPISTPTPLPTTTTTTTTTSTTPKPTHNGDGENIEEVSQKDVQVFQAPLVAAFTVHQDEQGQPKSVVPIFQQNLPSPTKIPLEPPVPTQNVAFNQGHDVSKVHPVFISQQIALQRQLEEKQKQLEEQLHQLQLQQRQQEELLRKQQFFFQQKEAQRQQQQYLFEQEQLKRRQVLSEQQKQFNNFQLPDAQKPLQFQVPPNRPQGAQVTIQSSVPLDQNNFIVNHQQLPNREAVDFLIQLHQQQREQFPLQANHLPQGISNFLHPNQAAPGFQQAQNFNQIRPADDSFRPRHGNRIFRQESGVGNFGINNQQAYNRFNTFNPVQSNRFFPSNRQNQFSPDAELKHLLVKNGLNGRSHEDLNIVTKVLSLNHGIAINSNISNRLPFDSRRHVRN